jgi:hypothetical protein
MPSWQEKRDENEQQSTADKQSRPTTTRIFAHFAISRNEFFHHQCFLTQ